MNRFSLARAATALFAVATCASAASADTLFVDGIGGPGAFFSIQEAINAAESGDVVLIGPGTYSGFNSLGKSLTILGFAGPESATPTRIATAIEIENHPLGQPAVVSNLIADKPIVVRDNDGLVVLDDLWIETLNIARSADVRAHRLSNALKSGSHQITDSRVEIVESNLVGLDGVNVQCDNPGDGRDGLTVAGNSLVHLVRTSMRGGEGGDVACQLFFLGGDGGNGLLVLPQAVVQVSGEPGTLLRGGNAGLGADCQLDGSPGNGARVIGGTLRHSLAAFQGGVFGCGGQAGGLIATSGVATLVSPPEPTLGWTGSTAAGTNTRFELQGPPSAPALLAFGSSALQLPFADSLLGVMSSWDLAILVGQTEPTDGGLTFLVQVPGIVPTGTRIPTQAAVLFPNGQWRLTNSVTTLVL